MKVLKRVYGLVLMICIMANAVLAQSPTSPFSIGDEAPNFKGKDQFGQTFELQKAIKKGPVVLLFYRGYWCPYCNKQLSQMEDSLNFITEKGGTVVAVTPDKPEGIKKTLKNTEASFVIIHDMDFSIMDQYQVGFRLDEKQIQKYKSKDLYSGENPENQVPNLPVPATYIIGADGKILYAFYDPDYRKRATVGKILENI